MNRKPGLVWKVIGTFLGLGYSPVAPGTAGAAGALVAAAFILYFARQPYIWIGGLIIVFTILGGMAAGRLQKAWGKDPSRVVIDEAVGMWIGVMWIGTGWLALLSAFALFRILDIYKPFGIRRAEKLPGGTGIMADDVAAGLLTNLAVRLGAELITLTR